MVVKYIDIDYYVFMDVVCYVVEGNLLYLRMMYCYILFLFIFLMLNIILYMCFGKVMFVIFDLFVGYLLYKIVGV